MRHASLFSGIGGFDLAAKWMGWTNVFHCEWNAFGQRVLRHHFPNAEGFGDITKTDFTPYADRIDILTGGFPCQPYSVAGKRKGKADERHLWPEMLRAIREVRPRYVVGENVGGIVSWNRGLVFDEVHTDLEAAGYEVQSFILPACGVNAPHRRDRVWFTAHSNNAGTDNGSGINEQREAENQRWERQPRFEHWQDGKNGITTNADNERCEKQHLAAITDRQKQYNRNAFARQPGDWQNFPTQPPVCGRNYGISCGLAGITFPKHRNESIKAYGNAIVPQVAYEIFKAIESTHLLSY